MAETITFKEPSITTLLVLISFLYFLQVSRKTADRLFGAGLLGEIAIGVIYGPVAGILPEAWLEPFLVVGYLGLILIVFEGLWSSVQLHLHVTKDQVALISTLRFSCQRCR